MVSNEDRAAWAETVLLIFSRMTGLDPEEEKGEAVGDLIANIGHYCDRNGLDFLPSVEAAISLWDVEKREEEAGQPDAMYPHKEVTIVLKLSNQNTY